MTHSVESNGRRAILRAASLLPLSPLAMLPNAMAESTGTYPNRPITWVVPYPAGGMADMLARDLTAKLSVSMKQTFIVDNRPGAGGQIGAAFVRQQAAEGYTVLQGDLGPFAMNAALYPKIKYETLKDFAPITRLMTGTTVLIVPPNSPIKSLSDLVRSARGTTAPNYGSWGQGSFPHVWTVLFQRHVKGTLTHVPYKGAAPALQDLMAGQIEMLVDVVPTSAGLIKEGKVRALALIGSPKRIPQLPDVPTIAELGMPELNLPGWMGVVGLAGTPAPVLDLLNAEIGKALQSPDLLKKYSDLGLYASANSRSDFAELIRTETQRWGEVIRGAGITLE